MAIERRTLLTGLVGLATAAAGVAAVVAGNARDRAADRFEPPYPSPEAAHTRPDPSILEALFRAGNRFVLFTGTALTARIHNAGLLRLPTGRLIAADPDWLPSWRRLDVHPFTVGVPAGAYPVTLALLEWRDEGRQPDAMVAAAKVTVQDMPVSSWEFALRPGQDPASLADDEFFGIGVDAAVMGLFDAVALLPLARLVDEDPLALSPPSAYQPLDVVDPGSGANVIAFQTGLGDGHYPVWIGRTPGGSVGCFIVDMLVPLAPSQ